MSNEEFEILAAKAVKADQAAMAKIEMHESNIDSLYNSLVANQTIQAVSIDLKAEMAKIKMHESNIDSLYNSLVAELSPLIKGE